MKNTILVLAIIAFTIISCKKEQANPKDPIIIEASTKECYMGVFKSDTVLLSYTLNGADATGKLQYNFFEKDKADGSLSGTMKGDTLFANYIFVSEGITSEREVVFLKKDSILIEGYGDIADDNKGKTVFKDKRKLFFDSKTVLTKTDCKK